MSSIFGKELARKGKARENVAMVVASPVRRCRWGREKESNSRQAKRREKKARKRTAAWERMKTKGGREETKTENEGGMETHRHTQNTHMLREHREPNSAIMSVDLCVRVTRMK